MANIGENRLQKLAESFFYAHKISKTENKRQITIIYGV
jgi:hypothetical protein